MNVQLIDGASYLNTKNEFEYTTGFGRIRSLNFVIIKGEMTDPENFKAQASASIWFYPTSEIAIGGKQPIYTIDINLQDTEIIAILDINENGYSISEKKLYDYFLTINNNSELFEIV